MNNYILDDQGNPVIEPDIIKWGEWRQNFDPQIAKDTIGGVLISTVFLGVDHGFHGTPILYETMGKN